MAIGCLVFYILIITEDQGFDAFAEDLTYLIAAQCVMNSFFGLCFQLVVHNMIRPFQLRKDKVTLMALSDRTTSENTIAKLLEDQKRERTREAYNKHIED